MLLLLSDLCCCLARAALLSSLDLRCWLCCLEPCCHLRCPELRCYLCQSYAIVFARVALLSSLELLLLLDLRYCLARAALSPLLPRATPSSSSGLSPSLDLRRCLRCSELRCCLRRSGPRRHLRQSFADAFASLELRYRRPGSHGVTAIAVLPSGRFPAMPVRRFRANAQ